MDKHNIMRNSVFFSFYKILNVVFPFITSIYVSRILMPGGIGQVASAQNIAAYFIFGAALGIPIYGTRVIARSRDSQHELNKSFSELFVINLISTVLFLAAYAIVLGSGSAGLSDIKLLFICGIPIALNVINIDWLYQGLEKYQYIAFRSFACKLLALFGVILFVKKQTDVISYATILVFASSANYILNAINIRKVAKLDFHGISLARHLKPIIVLFFSSLAIELYTMVDITMLTYWWDDTVVGLYANATKTVKIVITFLTAISAVALPRFSIYSGRGELENISRLGERTLSVLIYISLPSAAGLCLMSGSIIRLFYGDAFLLATPTMQILAVLVVPITLSTFLGSHLLCAINMEKKMLYAVIAGAVTNVSLNLVLIPTYAQNGAAVASVISECVVFAIDLSLVLRHVHLKMNWKNLLQSIVATAIMVALVSLVKHLQFSSVLQLLVAVLGGITVYVIASVVMRNAVCIIILEELRAIVKAKQRKKNQ